MDPRRLRTDGRKRHDGVDDDPTHQPGPVVSIDPATDKPRRNVTAEDQATANELLGKLTFEEQKDAIRKANSILLARTLAKIEAGATDESTFNALAKASNIAKQWTQEERQGGDKVDYDKLTVEQLKAAADGGK